MHDKEFDKVINRANQKYQSKKKEYDESWKTMHIIELDERLREEFGEYLDASSRGDRYEELLDVINIALMMAERLRT